MRFRYTLRGASVGGGVEEQLRVRYAAAARVGAQAADDETAPGAAQAASLQRRLLAARAAAHSTIPLAPYHSTVS